MRRHLIDFGLLIALTFACLLVFTSGLDTVPPLDRDEPRFAQASRQMLETGDFIDIRFQDQARHKKPVGIYWLQAISVSLFSEARETSLWAWRLVSVLGALAAVLSTYWAGRILFDRKAAFAAAAILGGSLLLAVEAHIAKTDAVLLACIVAAQAVLAHAYMAANRDPPVPRVGTAPALVFWAATGIGILIKGPIGPMISVLTIVALLIVDRRAAWLKALRWRWGPVLCLAIAAPWFIAISVVTDGTFFSEAIGGDLAPKLAGSHESKGAPPGTYLVLAAVTLWPGSLLLWPSIVHAVHRHSAPAVRFCLAWIVPAWLVFELTPSKLAHYPLPVYPALALLIGAALYAGAAPAGALTHRYARIWYALWSLVGIALGVALVVAGFLYGGGLEIGGVLAGMAAIAGTVGAARFAWTARPRLALVTGMTGGAITVGVAFLLLLPNLDGLWLSRSITSAAQAEPLYGEAPFASAGFSEPSLVFLLGTDTVLTDGAGAANHLQAHRFALVAVTDEEQPAFLERLTQLELESEPLATVGGLNYSRGDAVSLTLYQRRDAADEP